MAQWKRTKCTKNLVKGPADVIGTCGEEALYLAVTLNYSVFDSLEMTVYRLHLPFLSPVCLVSRLPAACGKLKVYVGSMFFFKAAAIQTVVHDQSNRILAGGNHRDIAFKPFKTKILTLHDFVRRIP